MTISYRKLSPADSKLYREIRLECLKAHPENFGSTFEEQDKLPKLMFEAAIERSAQDRFVIGAFEEQELIGIGGFVLSPPGADPLPKMGIVIQMYVRSTHSGQKIGLSLIRAIIKEAFEIYSVDQIRLEVKQGNIPAIRTYEQAGFQTYQSEQDGASLLSDDSRHMRLCRDDL